MALGVFSPILSHTLIVVVQWPEFDHSTTLNNKELQSTQWDGTCPITLLTSKPGFGDNIRLTRPRSHKLCKMLLSVFSPIPTHTLTVVVQWPEFGHSTTLNNKSYKPHRHACLITLLTSKTCIWWKYQVDPPPLPQAMQDVTKCFFSYSFPYNDFSGAMAKVWPQRHLE